MSGAFFVPVCGVYKLDMIYSQGAVDLIQKWTILMINLFMIFRKRVPIWGI